jgi:hypothetical protein
MMKIHFQKFFWSNVESPLPEYWIIDANAVLLPLCPTRLVDLLAFDDPNILEPFNWRPTLVLTSIQRRLHE